ncbi:DUF4263 domain-containing protein [Leptospira levettii]|uniref:Shedu immune nuclease family protein n=1 Tax=Leptospira levettii TaxID=2023178 RepID=UPI0010843726|nr:Shedu immune nuclease family protein [Leptospira levettii]TGL14497.1 DUF4263 domain-containing protein [Leptospira levettii]
MDNRQIRKIKEGNISKWYITNNIFENENDILLYLIDRENKKIVFYPIESYNARTKKHKLSIQINGFTKLPPEFHEKGYIKLGGSYYLIKTALEKNIKSIIIDRNIPKDFTFKNSILSINYDYFRSIIQELKIISLEQDRQRREVGNKIKNIVNSDKYPFIQTSKGIKIKRIIENIDDTIIKEFTPEQISTIENFYHNLIDNKYINPDKKTQILHKNLSAIESKVIKFLLKSLKELISKNATELEMGNFLKQNLFIIDSRYHTALPEINVILGGTRRMDFGLIDFNSNLDIFEIKRPNTPLLAPTTDHGNYYFHSDLIKALTQTEKYLYNAESRQSTLEKDISRHYNLQNTISIIRPSAFLIVGNSQQLDSPNKKEDFSVLRKSYKNTQIILYDELYNRLELLESRL